MNYLSVCSGIEAASVAWHNLGWEPVAFSEIEPFPSAVLAHRYPGVQNLGDMTKFKEWNLGKSIDLLVGGTPCQSFSVAGLRKGLADPRGNLMLTYGAIADHFKPSWIVWENVPGVLSSNGGRDFGTFLGMLGELGYGFAYRILDAQYYGVAQRRRRVFVVGYLGDWRPAAQVLFESESLRWNTPPSREARKRATTGIAIRTANTSSNGWGIDEETAYTLDTTQGQAICFEPRSPDGYPRIVDGGVAPTLNRMAEGQREPCVLIDQGVGVMTEEISKCLTKGCAQRLDADTETFVTHGPKVRKLTPIECERLQGFPSVINRSKFKVCYDHQSNFVNVEIECHKLQNSVLSAEESLRQELAQYAEVNFKNDQGRKNQLAVVRVPTSHGQTVVASLNQGKYFSSVNGAGKKNTFHQFMQQENFAQAVALISLIVERETKTGKVELHLSKSHSTHHQNGRWLAAIFGQENEESVSAVENSQQEVIKYITLNSGLNFQNLNSKEQTWLYFALDVISSCIQEKISRDDFYEFWFEVESGWTQIPWRGKPADDCPDGPRYKACGNSMAVPVMRWIGERIAKYNK